MTYWLKTLGPNVGPNPFSGYKNQTFGPIRPKKKAGKSPSRPIDTPNGRKSGLEGQPLQTFGARLERMAPGRPTATRARFHWGGDPFKVEIDAHPGDVPV